MLSKRGINRMLILRTVKDSSGIIMQIQINIAAFKHFSPNLSKIKCKIVGFISVTDIMKNQIKV